MSETTIVIAADHGGVALKAEIAAHLEKRGFTVHDLGTDGPGSVDYPDYAQALAAEIAAGTATRGILICGSGIGMSIAANRHAHIRAALVSERLSAELCRRHNDANVLCLGERLVGPAIALDCVDAFLDTAFEGGRHARRVDKLG